MCNTALICEGIAKKQRIMENNSFATELHFKRNCYHKRVRKITRLLTLQLNILFYLADMWLHFAWVVDDAKCIVSPTSVCLSVRGRICACLHYCTDPDVTWGSGRGCPLVVHYWADLQSWHGLRCYGNVTRTRNVSEYVLVLALCLVYIVACSEVTKATMKVNDSANMTSYGARTLVGAYWSPVAVAIHI